MKKRKIEQVIIALSLLSSGAAFAGKTIYSETNFSYGNSRVVAVQSETHANNSLIQHNQSIDPTYDEPKTQHNGDKPLIRRCQVDLCYILATP